jgi:hypothetical protein
VLLILPYPDSEPQFDVSVIGGQGFAGAAKELGDLAGATVQAW